MKIRVAAHKDRSELLERLDMASLLVDMGFADVDPDSEEQLLFCIFHSDVGTKSFSVNLEKKAFHCFSGACGVKGYGIQLYALWKGITYNQACAEIEYLPKRRDLAKLRKSLTTKSREMAAIKRMEVLTSFAQAMPLLSASKYASVLESRGITKEAMDRFDLRAYDEQVANKFDAEQLFMAGISNVWRRPLFGGNPILFPFHRGESVVFIQGRQAVDDVNRSKYLGNRGSIPCCFNHQVLSTQPKRVFVAEGAMDALSLEALGLGPAIGVVGTEGFNPDWVHDFKGVEEIWMAFDHDAAGEKAVGTVAKMLAPSGARLMRLDFPAQYKDINLALLGGWKP